MTVLDTSGAVDYLLGWEAAPAVGALFEGGDVAAPDVLVFEVLAVLRRVAQRRSTDLARANAAVADLGDLAVDLFPSLGLRGRAWELRSSMTIADGLFVALAEQIEEPLATKDRGLARAARRHAAVEILAL